MNAIGNPNFQGPFGNTLLHSAVLGGDPVEVARLLAAGADVSIANRDGQTPLHVAALLGRRDLYELLARRVEIHIERLLDQALEATFPASDAVALVIPASRRPR